MFSFSFPIFVNHGFHFVGSSSALCFLKKIKWPKSPLFSLMGLFLRLSIYPCQHAVQPVACRGSWMPGVTGQSIPPAGLYPGLKRPRLDYTRVYYGLGQFIPRG